MNTLGRLQKVDLRTEWSSEDKHFTPWLGTPENLDVLADTLGMDIEPIDQERPVGPFRADLVCQDRNSEELILIENQLEKTDHTHLGQLLTYAAGLQAVTVVWIAKKFTDEHIAALSWLNDHTNEKVNLFGLEVELWKIGDSSAAPKFNIVAKPNDWIKSGSSMRQTGLSETQQMQHEYWTGFKAWVEDHGAGIFRPTKPGPQHWMNVSPFGRSAFGGGFIVNTIGNEIRFEMTCYGDNHKQHFAFIENHKTEIEEKIGNSLSWNQLPGKMTSRIALSRPDTDWRNEKDREQQYKWLLANSELFVSVMKPYCDNAVATVET